MHTAFLMLLIGLFAGTMGAILGIGGGMIITPIITLGMGLPIKYAIGASIIAVIATSSGSTIAFLKDDVLNLRVAMFLELATSIGAIVGALLTGVFNPAILYFLFGCLLLFASWNMVRKLRSGKEVLHRATPDKLAEKLKMGKKSVESYNLDLYNAGLLKFIPNGLELTPKELLLDNDIAKQRKEWIIQPPKDLLKMAFKSK